VWERGRVWYNGSFALVVRAFLVDFAPFGYEFLISTHGCF